MRIWIDLANSPHALLFSPVAVELEERGHEVAVTARDHGQTVELALERWPDAEVIGRPSPPGRRAKAQALAARVGSLRGWARSARADLALSHNSYAQLAAARSLGLESVTAMDYEHQPANHLAFRLAHRVLVPEVFPELSARLQGARPRKLVRYAGLKEELYLGDFEPDSALPEELLGSEPARPLVVARTPPSGALYHQFENPLFTEAIQAVSARGASSIVLTRSADQRRALNALGIERCVVPERAVDSRSLLYAADLFIGAGGTMTREAALLGVPTLSAFAGASTAVDRQLESRGLLGRLTDPAQVRDLEPRAKEPRPLEEIRSRGRALVAEFVDAALGA